MAERKLTVEIVGDSRSLEKAFGRSARASDTFNAKMSSSTASVARWGKAVGVAAAAATAGAVVIGTKAVQAASNLSEQINKSNVVFAKNAQTVQAWSKTTASALGISQREALEAAGGFGQLLQTAGITENASAGMSQALVKLAADMASFNNITPDEALLKLKSGLAGEAEPLRTVGVLLSEARVKQEAYASGIAKTGDELTEGQKVQARYQLILQDTAKQQGDFARTSESLANSQRIVRAQIENASASIGAVLLPVVAKATSGIAHLIEGLSKARTIRAKFTFIIEGLEDLGRDVLERARAVLAGTDWGEIGRIVGQQIADGFGQAAAFLRTVDWGAVGQAVVRGIADFLKGVNWKDVAVGTIKLMVAAFVATRKLLLGIGIELGRQLMGGIGDGIDRLVPLILQKLLQFVNKVLSVTKFLGRFDPFAGVRDRVKHQLDAIQRDIDAFNKSAAIEIPVSATRGGRPSADTRRPGGAPEQDAATAGAAGSAAAAAAAAAKKRADAAKKAAAAAKKAKDKAIAAFQDLMDSLSLKFDRAEVRDAFKQELAILDEQEAAVRAEIKVEGRTVALERELFRIAQDRKDIREQIAQARADANKARQFRALGLTAEGDEPALGPAGLLKRINQAQARLKAAGKLTPAIVAKFAQIRAVIKREGIKLGRDVRLVIDGIIDDIVGGLQGKGKTGPITKGRVVNIDKLLEDMGLTPEQKRALRDRFSGIGPTTRVSTGGGAGARGRPFGGGTGPVVQQGGIVITGPVTVVSNDPDQFHRQLQRKARRKGTQTTGPHAGNSMGHTR